MENTNCYAVLSSEKERNSKYIKNLQVNREGISRLKQCSSLLSKGLTISTIAGVVLMNPSISVLSLGALTLFYGAYCYYQKSGERLQEELKLRCKWDQSLTTKMNELDYLKEDRSQNISVEERIEYLFELYTSTVLDELSMEDITSLNQSIDRTNLSTKIKSKMKEVLYHYHKEPKRSY